MRRHAFTFYCLLCSALAVLAAEFVLMPRLYGLPRDTLLMGFAAQPGTVIDGQVINSMGFTGDVIAGPKPDDTVRILLLGSSTLFNRHLADRLKAALQARTTKKIALLNAGIRSHTSRADVLKWQLLAQHEWDYVLFYDGINDLWANHVRAEDFRDDYAHLDVWYRRNVVLDNSLLARYGYNFFVAYANKLNVMWGERWFPAYQFVFPKKPFVNAANFLSLQSFAGNVSLIVEESRQLLAVPVLISFAYHLPENYSRQAFLAGTLDYSNPDQYDVRDVFNWGPPDYMRKGLAQQNAILQELAAEKNIMLVDADTQMSGRGVWFGDVCHFNDEGVDIFVRLVAGAIFP